MFGNNRRTLDLPILYPSDGQLKQDKADEIKVKISDLQSQLEEIQHDIQRDIQRDKITCIHEFDPTWMICRKYKITLAEFHWSATGG